MFYINDVELFVVIVLIGIRKMNTNIDIDALYRLHQKELTFFIIRIGLCREVSQELTQESFINLSNQAKKQKVDHPRGLLFRIARNLALDYLKHEKVTNNYAQSNDPSLKKETQTSSVEHVSVLDQRAAIVNQVIDELSPRCREVFIMSKILEKTYAEIASELNISESGVEKHIMKGLLHCKKRLKVLLDE